MDKSLYDEFGNYTGALDDLASGSSEDEDYSIGEDQSETGEEGERAAMTDDEEASNEIAERKLAETATAIAESQHVVPHEDKKIYPDAEEVYGDAEVLIHEEDTQPISEPILASTKTNYFDILERAAPTTTFDVECVKSMMQTPSLIRHIAVCGHLHHGKTSLCDMMVTQTHTFNKPIGQIVDDIGNIRPAGLTGPERATLRSRKQEARTRELKYTDCRADEQERGISIKASPVSLVLPDSRGKSYLVNIMDTPGHVNFMDEATAALRLADGVLLCVDALEGPMLGTRKVIENAVREGSDMILVLTCLDRLILELRLPPADAFYKLRFMINKVNELVQHTCEMLGKTPREPFSPARGNTAFASGRYSFVFTLESMAKLYKRQHLEGKLRDFRKADFDVETFSKFLWGNVWWNPETRKFQTTKPEIQGSDEEPERTFVHFVLEPLYKLIAHVVGEEKPTLAPTLEEFNIFLDDEDYLLDTRSLLRKVCGLLFVDTSALIDCIVRHVRSPVNTAADKVELCYTGNQETSIAHGMRRCDPSARLMIHTTKNYHRPDGPSFDVFGRVFSGTIRKGQLVKILGERYSLDDDEDMLVRDVSHLWVYQSRYRIEVDEVPAGNWVLIGGVDPLIRKTATITDMPSSRPVVTGEMKDTDDPNSFDEEDEVEIFSELQFPISAVIRVACEPLVPSELPKMLEGLRKISKSYPLLRTKVEDSGEHVIITTGELATDCALHDLRKIYGDLEIRCADPVVSICETVIDRSVTKAFADTPNKMNRITMIAEPLEAGIGSDIENGILSAKLDAKALAAHLKDKFDWDTLASRSVWAFSNARSPNLLINDILPSVNKDGHNERKAVNCIKDLVVHAFQWATREGPLIEEEVRNVKLKLLDAKLATEPIHRNGGQIIPTVRRVAYSSFLLATPRLMEPMFFAEIVCPADCVSAVLSVLSRRRGHMNRDIPNPGTPLEIIHAYIPGIDSFGFETDIRTHTSGQAFVLTTFDSWEVMPGDPLDTSIVLRPLEPAPAPHLAREFLLKTRRRKGLSGDVSINKFFDDAMLESLKQI